MIKTKDLGISFSGQKIFSDVSVNINKKEKIGFIGRNGSGKSTFLKIIIGRLEQDDGEVIMPKGYKIGYLDQHIKFTHKSVVDEVCSVLSGDREYEIWKGESILTGLGFTDEEMSKDPEGFSGGNQVKINLAKLLLEGELTEADVVLGLDTNLISRAKETGLFAKHSKTLDLNLPIAWDDDTFIPFDWGYFAFV